MYLVLRPVYATFIALAVLLLLLLLLLWSLLSPSAIAPYEHFSNVLHRKCLLCFLLRTISLAATTTTTAGIKQSE